MNEIRILYALQHPNIIKLYNHYEDEENVTLVLEYGYGSLDKILGKKNRLDEKMVYKYIK